MTSVRYIAPAGAPIAAQDLVRWTGLLLSGRDPVPALAAGVRERFGVRHVWLTTTGRAGLTVLLRALRRLAPADRIDVVIPSYTCYSVAASIVKAGLRPRLVDISTETLDYAPGALAREDLSRTLAIIATNLYGLPNDLEGLSALAAARGIFVIDDAAQAMGAEAGGRLCGTRGDAGLFSLDKGKNVSAIDGGIVVSGRDDIAEAMQREMAILPPASRAEALAGCAKALVYFGMLRPWLYGIPARLPQLGLGQTIFTTDFPLELPSRPLMALALTMIERLDRFTAARVERAGSYLAGLQKAQAIRPIRPQPATTPVYLRLPVLVASEAGRERSLAALQELGIGATGSYPECLADVGELRASLANADAAVPGGRFVARHLLTLPTHPFVTSHDIASAIACLVQSSHVPATDPVPAAGLASPQVSSRHVR